MLQKEKNTVDIGISQFVRFWLYLFLEIPSVICSIFVLYHLLFNRILRTALHNHIIIILLGINLIIELTNIPWILHYYRLGQVVLATRGFCMIWIFIDEALSVTTTILFAWATIERHILKFHDQLVSTRIKVLFVHYFPIGFLIVYCLCYSIAVIIVPSCENTFNYTLIICGHPLCYYEHRFIALWDAIINHIIPTFVIILSSATLFGCILYQKKRIHQPIRLRRHRKMAIQLLSISVLYLILYIPEMMVEFVHLCGISEETGENFIVYADFFSYYVYFLFPFVCAGSLPQLTVKLKNLFPCCWRKQRRVIAPKELQSLLFDI